LSLHAYIVSVHVPPRLHFEPLKLLNLDFKADPDPDPDSHSKVSPDPNPASKINADQDPQPWLSLPGGPQVPGQDGDHLLRGQLRTRQADSSDTQKIILYTQIKKMSDRQIGTVHEKDVLCFFYNSV
jgi:hypothetical protein